MDEIVALKQVIVVCVILHNAHIVKGLIHVIHARSLVIYRLYLIAILAYVVVLMKINTIGKVLMNALHFELLAMNQIRILEYDIKSVMMYWKFRLRALQNRWKYSHMVSF